jgi:hypothetical protein
MYLIKKREFDDTRILNEDYTQDNDGKKFVEYTYTKDRILCCGSVDYKGENTIVCADKKENILAYIKSKPSVSGEAHHVSLDDLKSFIDGSNSNIKQCLFMRDDGSGEIITIQDLYKMEKSKAEGNNKNKKVIKNNDVEAHGLSKSVEEDFVTDLEAEYKVLEGGFIKIQNVNIEVGFYRDRYEDILLCLKYWKTGDKSHLSLSDNSVGLLINPRKDFAVFRFDAVTLEFNASQVDSLILTLEEVMKNLDSLGLDDDDKNKLKIQKEADFKIIKEQNKINDLELYNELMDSEFDLCEALGEKYPERCYRTNITKNWKPKNEFSLYERTFKSSEINKKLHNLFSDNLKDVEVRAYIEYLKYAPSHVEGFVFVREKIICRELRACVAVTIGFSKDPYLL